MVVTWQGGSSATVMNLSLLTSDFWSVLVGVTLLGERVGYWCAAPRVITCHAVTCRDVTVGVTLLGERVCPCCASRSTALRNGSPSCNFRPQHVVT